MDVVPFYQLTSVSLLPARSRALESEESVRGRTTRPVTSKVRSPKIEHPESPSPRVTVSGELKDRSRAKGALTCLEDGVASRDSVSYVFEDIKSRTDSKTCEFVGGTHVWRHELWVPRPLYPSVPLEEKAPNVSGKPLGIKSPVLWSDRENGPPPSRETGYVETTRE